MARRCVFCGEAGLTREHVVPRWLTKVLPEQAKWRGQDQTVVHIGRRGPGTELSLPHREVPEPFGAVTVKAVCAECNAGWMSDLEQAAAPTLTALVRSDRVTLDSSALSSLAAWAVKTSLMAQLTGATPASLDSVYRAFRAEPPANAAVWAGAIRSDDWALRAESVGVLVADPDSEVDMDQPYNTLTTTLGMGSLLLHTVLTARPEVSYPPLDELFPLAVVRIWPRPEPVDWPPPFALADRHTWWIRLSLHHWLSE